MDTERDPLHGFGSFLVGRAYQATRQLADRLLAEHGLAELTPGMGPILFHLFEHDACPMRDIVQRCRLDKATVTNQVAAMERAGLVRRQKSRADKRCVLVCLTDRGRELAQPSRRLLVDLESRLRAPFDARRWQRLRDDLRELIQAIEAS